METVYAFQGALPVIAARWSNITRSNAFASWSHARRQLLTAASRSGGWGVSLGAKSWCAIAFLQAFRFSRFA